MSSAKHLLLSIFLLSSCALFAQEGEVIVDDTSKVEPMAALMAMMSTELTIEAPDETFENTKMNCWYSADHDATINLIFLPEEFSKVKEDFAEPSESARSEHVKSDILDLDGVETIFEERKAENEDTGEMYTLLMYGRPDGNETLSVSAVFPKKKKKELLPLITESVKTLRRK